MDAGQAFKEYSSYVQDAAKNSTVFGRAVTTLTGAAKSFGATLLNIGVAFAATWVITEVVNLIDDAIHRSERLIEAGKEAQQAAQEIYSAYTGKQSSVSDLASGLFDDRSFENFYDSLEAIAQKYAELRTGVNPLTGENISLSVEQYQQYLDINNQLASLFPSLISGTTAQGDTLVDLGNNAAEATTKLQELMDAQRAMSYFNQREQMPDIIAGFEEQYNNYKEDLADLEKEQQDLLDLMNTINSASIDFEDGILTFPTALSEANPKLVKDIQDILPQYTASIDGENYVIKFDKDKITDDIETQLTDALDAGKAEALNNLDTDYYDLNVQMDNTKAELKTAVQDTMSTIADTFATNKTIANLPSDIQNMFLSGLKDESFIESLMAREDFNADTLMQDLEQRLVVPLDNISEEASESLSNLFEVDPSDLSLQEYSTQIQKVLGDAFGKDWGTFYDLFGFDEYFKEYGNMSAALAKQFEQDKESIYDMSASDLEIAYDLVVNDGFTGTFNALLAAIERVKSETTEIEPITFESIISSDDEGSIGKAADTIQSDISSINSALESLGSGTFSSESLSELIQQFPQLASQTDNLGQALSRLNADKLNTFVSQYTQAMSTLTDPTEIENATSFLNSIIDSADLSGIDTEYVRGKITEIFTPNADDPRLEQQAIRASQNVLDSFTNELETDYGREILLKLSLNPESANWSAKEWQSQFADSLQTYADSLDIGNLVNDEEFTAKVQEYRDLYATLTEAQDQLSAGTFTASSLSTLIDEVPELAGETDNLESAISDLLNTADTNIIDYFADSINALKEAGRDVDASNLQNYLDILISSVREAENISKTIGSMTFDAPGLKEIEDSLGKENQGSMYEQLLKYYEQAKDLYDKGLVGTDDFKSIAKMFSPNGMDDVGNFAENMGKIGRYMTEDSTGVENFLDDLESKGYATMEKMADGTEKWAYNMTDLESAAHDMGMSYEWFLSMFGRLNDYGFSNDFFASVEDGQKHLTDLYSSLSDEEQKLKDLQEAKADGDTTVTDTVIAEQEAKIAGIRDSIQATQDLLDQLASRTTQDYEQQAKSAADTARSLVNQLSETSDGSVREMIESDIEGLADEYHLKIVYDSEGNITDVVTKGIEEGQQAANEKPIQVPMNITTDDEQINPEIPSVDEVVHRTLTVDTVLGQDNATAEIESKNPTVPVNTETDTSEVQGAIEGKEYTANVNAEVNSSGSEPITEDATVNYKRGEQEEPESQSTDVNYNLGIQEAPVPKTTTVNYSLGTQANPLPKTVKVNYDTSGAPSGATALGTAHATGTAFMDMWTDYRHSMGAFAGGTSQDWALPRNEDALVNEVGTESIVRDGVWRLIPGGAHVESLKKNDIIFNAKQTEELRKYGKVLSGGGHGRIALADGTAHNVINAYAAGSGGGSFRGGAASSSSSSSGITSYPSSSSSSGKSSAKKTVKENKEVAESFDWIARRIALVERYIDRLDLRASSAYRDFSKRNVDLNRQIGKINNQLKYEEKAYKRYLQEAESVGLSDHYESLVRKGTIDIEKIKDEDLIEKINEYQKWWDLSREEFDKIQELEEDLGDAYSSAFDMVMTEFDGILSEFEHKNTLLEGYIDQAEALGYMANEKYYEALKNVENQNLSALQQERNELISSLESAVNAGAIKQGSEAWNDMQSEINGVTEAIQESQNAIIEYNNEIRQIQWDRFDYLRDSISRITDEADFLIDLMSNDKLFGDKGEFSNEGFATLGLRGQNYNTYMEQSLAYAKEIQKIEAEMAKNPYDTNLIERRNELLDQQYDMILAAEDEKDAIVDLVEEGINLHLDALQELIDKYTEALDQQKNLYDFQNNIKDQTSEIASLEKQMLAWRDDTSEEGRSRFQQTQAALEEARQNLEETQYDKYISDTKDLLDGLFNDYSDFLNSKLENTDQLITDVIAKINESGNQISDTLKVESSRVGYTISDSLSQVWSSTDGIRNILASYVNGVNVPLTGIKTVLDTISANVANLVVGSSQQAQASVDNATNASSNTNSAILSIINSEKAISSYKSPDHSDLFKYIFEKYGRTSTNETYVKLANALGVSLPNGMTKKKKDEILKVLKAKGYRSGGYIRKDEIAWTQEGGNPEAIIRPDGSILMPLTGGTYVVNADATKNLFDLANDPQKHITDMIKDNSTVMPNAIGMSGTVQNSVDLTVNLPNVTNYDEFVTRMQHDNKIQKMFQDMTVGQLAGKGSFARMKYKFNK